MTAQDHIQDLHHDLAEATKAALGKEAIGHVDAVADNVRRVHNEVGLPLSLSQALESLQRAEALLLETANS